MDVISISDSTEVSAGIHSLLLHYSVAKGAAEEKEGSPLTEEPVSLSSQSSERCPVTWRSKQKKKIKLIKNLINEKTPCATAKVQSWLSRNSQKGNFDALQLEALDGSTVLRLEPLQKGGSIFIRHDYNKDLISYSNAKPYYLSRNFFSAKKDSEVICLDSDDCSNTNPSDRDVNTPIEEDKIPQKKPRQKATDVPLSPESQKKSELCSYLQLMDMSCTDKKIGSAIQNRRSVRVQNLNMLSERKKLEKELLTEPKECADVNDMEVQENDKELAKKSFAELKINVPKENHEDAAAKSKPTATRNNFLSFETLPKKILECSVDFDEAMGAFIDAEKISVPIKPSRCSASEVPKSAKKSGVSPKRRSPQKYRNLRGSRKLILIKKKEGNSLLKKKSSPLRTVKKRHKSLNSIHRKLRQRKSPEGATNSKVDEVATNVNVVETITVNKDLVDLPQQNLGDEQNATSTPPQRRSNVSKKRLEERRRPKENKTMLKAFREKSFCVIDLSHQHDYTTDSGTLLDHNYASKPEIDKNYIMNVIVGQPFAEDEKKRGANFTVTVQKPDDTQFDPVVNAKLKANGQQKPATDDDEEELARKKKKKKKRKLTVTPVQRNYPDFGDELDGKVFGGGDEINLTVDERPPANIFDDTDYLKSPVSLSETCMKEILDNLGGGNDSNNEGASPIIGRKRTQYVPFNSSLEVKPLHKSLMRSKRKLWPQGVDSPDSTWDDKNISGGVKRRDDKRSYAIQISKRDGCVLNAFYLDFNLIIAQEQVISFWSQSALGNMLGAQNMWISKGSVQRLVTDGNCIFKRSSQAVISLENSVAYVELWIKEHKSDKRERPVADIFATIYFCRHRLNGPDKKVLQLENINGVASDVQYVVLRNSRNIIVSWCETCDDARRTYIHCYNLASDYQTVVSIREMGNVSHYITSLHNIEDCDTLVMGCGEHKVSLWNVEYSYVVATIEIDDIRSEPSTLWVKCDRGYLFMLLFYELEKMFKLIAINGIHHSWKRLKMFTFPSGYKGLRGVCLDNNILGAFYDNGVVCWNIQTGESVIEEMCSENVYIPSEKHIIILSSQGGILVRHALSHFITSYDL